MARKLKVVSVKEVTEANFITAYTNLCQAYNWTDHEDFKRLMVDILGRNMVRSLAAEVAKTAEVRIFFENLDGPGSELDCKADQIFRDHDTAFINAGTFLDKTLHRDICYSIAVENLEPLVADLKTAGFDPQID